MKVLNLFIFTFLLTFMSCEMRDDKTKDQDSPIVYSNSIKISTESLTPEGIWGPESFSEGTTFNISNFLNYNNICILIIERGMKQFVEDYFILNYDISIETKYDSETFHFDETNNYCGDTKCRIRSFATGSGNNGYSFEITFEFPVTVNDPVKYNQSIELDNNDIMTIVYQSPLSGETITKTINIVSSR